MNVHDVGSQYVELIKSQKKTLEDAQKRQGQRPHDRKSRDHTYGKFMAALLSTMSMEIRRVMVHTSFIPPPYPPCTTPINQLRPVAIRNLQLETHHRGTYLLLRSITPPSRMTAVMAVMEDENGDVLMVQLYQQEDEIKRAAADIVNIGTILLLKEPYFKIMGDGEYGLRVDHLSDVIHIRGNDARIPDAWKKQLIADEQSAESLKAKGNLSMEKKRYWDAITEYSDALNRPATADLIDILRRNRSLAFLKTNQFDAALSDSGYSISNPNTNEKALFRAADALYNLQKFSECLKVLKHLISSSPNNSDASRALERAKIRFEEQNDGVYMFKQLQAKAKILRPPHLDHATYIGPVEIRQTESKGRGLFLTKPVKAGDLLLCEKAFGHIYAAEDAGDGNERGSKNSVLLNTNTDQGFMGTQPELITFIVQKLYRNPSLAPAFTTLYHGTYEGVSTPIVDAEPIVDTFLVERIIAFNCFGSPVSSLNSHNAVCSPESPLPNNSKGEKAYHSCGIWTHASYINHCCISNARRAFIGNMMIIRASRDMEAGTEITFWYHIPDGQSPKDLDKRFQNWGFVCRCALCLDVRATEAVVFEKRRKLLEGLKRVFVSPTMSRNEMERFERLLDVLNQTYTQPAEAVPRIPLWDPQLALTRSYMDQNKMRKGIESAVKVLTSLGFVVIGADPSQTHFTVVRWGIALDHLVETFLHIRTAFLAIGSKEDSERAREYAKTAYQILVGENESFGANYQ